MSEKNGSILIVDDIDEIREIVTLMLESEFENNILEVSSGNKAIKIIKDQAEKIDLIISDYDMPDGNGSELYNYVCENTKIPFILLSSINLEDDQFLSSLLSDNKKNARIKKPFDHKELTEKIKDILSSDDIPQNTPPTKEQIYQRIKLKRISKFEMAFGDIYLKITDIKYVKVIFMDDPIDKDQINHYSEKNTEYLYMDKEQYEDYLSASVSSLTNKLANTSTKDNKIIGLQLNSIEEIRELVLSIGIKKNILDLTDQVSMSVNNKLKAEKNLKKFLGNMLNKENFFFQQSNITNYLASAIIKKLGLDMERTSAKMVQASIFCDVALDRDCLAIITNITNSDFKNLPLEKRQLVTNHIEAALKILKNSKGDFSEEEKIISNHHERPDGSGYPKKLTSTQIPPLSAIFNISHDFARLLILNGEETNINSLNILENMDTSYQSGNYKKAYEALKECLRG